MSKLRVLAYSVSLDGFGAGPGQDLEHPLGVRGEELMQWLFPTRMFQRMYGQGDGETGIDNGFAERGFDNLGAWILGRNMFGPVRGPWPDESWRGWWGEEPPYRVPVFVLTHHPRAPLEMAGGTTFHFVAGGIHEALERARTVPRGPSRNVTIAPNRALKLRSRSHALARTGASSENAVRRDDRALVNGNVQE